MPSPPDSATRSERAGRRLTDAALFWNRRVHYFLGLYLLFFCWLFALTGLLLNHPRWEFAHFWPDRVQTISEQAIQVRPLATEIERARDLMGQLGIAGEVQWPTPVSVSGPFAFQVSRPGLIVDVKADLSSGRATVQRTALNAWGVLHVLHTFTGERPGDTRNGRDWVLTMVWALAMDAVAVGLIVMVLGSYVMWFRLKGKRLGGLVALALGIVTCFIFIWSPGW